MTAYAPIHLGSPERPFIELPRLRPHGLVSDNAACQQDAEIAGAIPCASAPLSPAKIVSNDRDPPRAGDISFSLRPDGSVAAVIQERLRQLANGYSLDADGEKTVMQLLELAIGHAHDLRASWPIAPSQRVPAQLRRDATKAAACCLALIDRLDRGDV